MINGCTNNKDYDICKNNLDNCIIEKKGLQEESNGWSAKYYQKEGEYQELNRTYYKETSELKINLNLCNENLNLCKQDLSVIETKLNYLTGLSIIGLIISIIFNGAWTFFGKGLEDLLNEYNIPRLIIFLVFIVLITIGIILTIVLNPKI